MTIRSILAFCILGIAPLSAKEAPLKALLVCGGCCHDYVKQSVILRDGIQSKANIQVDVVLSDDSGTKPWFPMYENKDWAKGYDVVIHDECAADVKDMTYVRNIVNAHKNGLPGVNLHCAMHSYRTGTDLWFDYLGIQSSGHGPQKPIAVDFTDDSHPVTKGMANWTTNNEELYNNIKVFPSAKPLALGNQDSGNGKTDTSVVVWTNDFHGTRVFNTTLGHNNETVGDDRYLDLVVKGALWSCNKLTAAYLTPYSGPAGSFEKVSKKSATSGGTAPANATPVLVTASSTQADNEAWHVADGSADTRWCADGDSFPQWCQLEFEKETTLTGLKITWENNNACRYQIEGSRDGKQWVMLANGSDNTAAGDTEVTFPRAALKRIKISCLGIDQGGWASIREISATGAGIGPLSAKVTKDVKNKPAGGPSSVSKTSAEQEKEILKDVTVADGFDVSVFATSASANYPVYVSAAPNGDLYVSSDGNGSLGVDGNRGRILRLRDTDNDGRADQVTEFVKNIDAPRGIVWDHDRLYVIHPPDVSCYIDKNGDGESDEEKTLITGIAFGYKDRPADHTTNGLSLGIDGWLYISGGDFGFKDAVGTDGRHLQHRAGGVIRFRPDGSGLEIFSTGTRNILGTPISPLLDLFARDNTNDGGGWNVRFHHFTGLEDHGYPRMYMNFEDEIVRPLADYGGGSGCGSVYLSEPGFPTRWNNAPLTCDWGTNALWRHTVEPSGATFKETAKPEQLIKMTRPTDADVDGMSRLYQASWKGATFKWEGPDVGYIVRISPKGYKPEPLPNFNKLGDVDLIRLLDSPSQVRTLEAQRALLRRPGTAAMRDGLVAMAKDPARPLPARVAALYALTQRAVKAETATAVISSVAPLAADPQLQRFVLRALGDAGLSRISEGRPFAPAAIYAAGLKSADPRTRLEAIIGAARQNMVAVAPDIAGLLGDGDPVIAHTAFQALAKLKASDACFAVIDKPASPPEQKTGAFRALMRMHDPAVVQGLISRLATAPAASRLGILGALARLNFEEGEWKGDSWGTRPDTRGPYYQPENWSETPKITAALKSALDKASPVEASGLMRELRRNRIEFNDKPDRMFELVKKDPSALPGLISELAATETVNPDTLSFLLTAARGDWPAETLSQAVMVLARMDSKDGCSASLDALLRLSGLKDGGKFYESARKAFLMSPKLENHHQMLEDLAAKLDGPLSVWADAALLSLGERKEGSPEARELSKKATDHGWEDPKRRVQLLKAIQIIGFHNYDDKVRAAMEDGEAAVSAAARDTAASLKLEKKVEDKTPLVGSMKPEEVVAEVMKTKGDIATGQQMFARCTACHAVSADEPQKGPYLGNIAQTYSREELASNILDPGKTIAQGFATEIFTLKDGTVQMGFVTEESAGQVKVRNIAAQEFTWQASDIVKREKQPNSLMPPGLANDMTLRGFASLLDYLESLSKK
ncbi:MAG: ThuA domain-containing protein [Verrucomicrobiota bacterium]